jgi:hypothetical protein
VNKDEWRNDYISPAIENPSNLKRIPLFILNPYFLECTVSKLIYSEIHECGDYPK